MSTLFDKIVDWLNSEELQGVDNETLSSRLEHNFLVEVVDYGEKSFCIQYEEQTLWIDFDGFKWKLISK